MKGSDILDFGSRVHGFILVMQQLMLFFLFLELDQFLFEDILEVLYQLLVIFLDLRDLYLGALQHIVFDLVAVASHGDFEPLFQTGFHRSSVVVFLGAFLHLPEMLILDGVLFPSTEKSAFVVLGVEKSRKVFNFIPFFLNLSRYFGTFLLRIQ